MRDNMDKYSGMLIKCCLGCMVVILLISVITEDYNLNKITNEYSSEEFSQFLEEFIPSEMHKYDIPGLSIAIVNDSSLVYESAFGFSDIRSSKKMTVDTQCRVQSISKSLTAWGVIKLVQNGRIELDKPVMQYIDSIDIPSGCEGFEKITVRQLLSHTSGLALGDVMRIYSPEENKPTLRESLEDQISISNEAGRFAYSNVGYNILELVIEDITGQDYAKYMKKEVLMPLGMEHSTYTWKPGLEIPTGYRISGKAVPVYVYPEKASGGLLATAKDIALFASAGMINNPLGQSVLNHESIGSIQEPVTGINGIYSLVFDSYGLGLFIEEPDNGFSSFSHGGQGTGIMTHLQFVPSTGDAIVILTNSQRSWPFISAVLKAWAKWNGLLDPGMSKILLGRRILLILIYAGFFIVLLRLWHLAEGYYDGRRKFISKNQGVGLVFSVQISISALLLGLFIWNINLPYSTLSSVFPVRSVQIWALELSIAVSTFIYAMFPAVDSRIRVLKK